MPRLLFTKEGEAVWMSHLDLMRLFQRAFKRAGLPLTHTQGFNPRPSVSIALPLSVGVESRCELLDFDLEGEAISCEEIQRRLKHALVAGIQILDCYASGRKLRDLALLDCQIRLEYDGGIPSGAERSLEALFAGESLLTQKRSKNGFTQQDIIPMIRRIGIERESDRELVLKARICCQNPSLNPMQLVAAIERYAPELKPDHARYCRTELYDNTETIFR